MLVMTAKVDKKKIVMILAAVIALVVGLVMLFGGNDSQPTASTNVSNNDARVAFLRNPAMSLTATTNCKNLKAMI